MIVEALTMDGEPQAAAASARSGSRPDAALVARAQAGEPRAFERLMALHERQVLRTALRLLGRIDDARDAAQEVFLRLYRSLGRLDPERPLGAWLYRVTVNVCRDQGRRRARRAALALEQIDPGEHPVARGEGSDPSAQAVRAEGQRILAGLLARLPARERAALVLRDLEGLSTREVARVLRSSPTTVRSQISRARLRLRRFLRDSGKERPHAL